MEFFEIIQQPFMLRAIYGGLIVALLCSIVGVFVVLSNKSFIADGVAHGSLAGVAFALVLTTIEPLFIAMIVAITMALVITYIKQNSNVSQDAIIGILFTFFFAIGIIILSFSNSFQPEITRYLFGSILLITWVDIIISAIAFFFVLSILFKTYKQFLYTTFDPEAAQVRGVNVKFYEYLINVMTAIVIVVSIKMVGIVMVTALLIIPTSTAKLLADRFKQMIPLSITFAVTSTTLGLIGSVLFGIPSGPAIVVVATLTFASVFGIKQLR